ncbi:histidine phosphatase family protein [Candidatus Uhrbacteria bacterium]|nr:histidine phosphatase family protein [Candidatus Uhrbacteria bacterium]
MARRINARQGSMILVRHGESRLNALNCFTGWLDVGLTKKGLDEAHAVADHCRDWDYDAAFTSHLERAHETLLVILSHQKRVGIFQHESDARYQNVRKASKEYTARMIPIFTSRLLNERYYGQLQGVNKETATRMFGAETVLGWRRGFAPQPPGGESLRDVYNRVIPYFKQQIQRRVKRGQTILVVAHSNTLRAIIKFVEQIDDDHIPFVDLPTGHPLLYSCVGGQLVRTEGEYRHDRPLR